MVVGLAAGILLCLPHAIYAVTSISFSDLPTSVDEKEEVGIQTILYCSGCSGDSYIRGVFYPSGSSYFGYTQNNTGSWINASGASCTEYFKIALDDLKEGSWSGVLHIKPDAENSYYNGPGEYLFKLGRYTTSCGSPTWSSEKTITITGPTPTPTALPPTATATCTPSNTPTTTPTSTPRPSATVTPTRIPTQTSVEIKSTASPEISSGTVLGIVETASSSTEYNDPMFERQKPMILVLLGTGVGLACVAVVLAVWKRVYLKRHSL